MSRFTGGNHLKPEDGLKYYIHQAMMVNELSGGRGAYKISNAEKAASGPSFGPIQYDIGGNDEGRNLLERIAREATDSKGNRFISDNEIKQMQIHLYKPFNKMSAEDKQVYQNLKPKLNQALASEAGISLINRNYDKVLDKKVGEVHKVISKITNLENKQFLQSNMQAQVFIADIGNQYGKKVNEALVEFLSKRKEDNGVRLLGGRQVKVEGKLDMEDLKNFRMNTAYGVKHPADARRRDKHIEDVTAPTRENREPKQINSMPWFKACSTIRTALSPNKFWRKTAKLLMLSMLKCRKEWNRNGNKRQRGKFLCSRILRKGNWEDGLSADRST